MSREFPFPGGPAYGDTPPGLHAEIDRLLFALWERDRGELWAAARRDDAGMYLRDWGVEFTNRTGHPCPTTTIRGAPRYAPTQVETEQLREFRDALRTELEGETHG